VPPRRLGTLSGVSTQPAGHPPTSLHPPGSFAPLHIYLQRIWERRGYLAYGARTELQTRNQNTVLGNLWHLLNPVLGIAVYYLVFGLLLDTTRGVEYFLAFLAIGVFVFQFLNKSVTSCAGCLRRNVGLIRSITFPRAIVPMSTIITELLAFLPGVVVMLAVTLLTGAPVLLSWLAIIPLTALLVAFNTGAGLIAARMNHQFPDFENVLPFVFRLLFYGSGVLFAVDAYLDTSGLLWLFVANPVYSFLTLYRWAILGMGAYGWELVSVVAWTVGLLAAGFVWFRNGEASYGA